MKEELLKQLVEIIQKTNDFTIEQMPLVAKEIIKYGFVSSLVFLIIDILLILGCFFMVRRSMKVFDNDDLKDSDELMCRIKFITACILFIPLLIGIFYQTSDLIKVTTAPRLYIIDQLKPSGCSK